MREILVVSHVTLHGYKLTGSNSRTCQSDGSWSQMDGVCKRGTVTKTLSNWYIGSIIKYGST